MAVRTVWQATAADLNGIEYVIDEQIPDGATVALRIGLHDALGPDQLLALQEYQVARGLQLTSPLKMVSSPWPNTVEIQFKRPVSEGVGLAWGLALLGEASSENIERVSDIASRKFSQRSNTR